MLIHLSNLVSPWHICRCLVFSTVTVANATTIILIVNYDVKQPIHHHHHFEPPFGNYKNGFLFLLCLQPLIFWWKDCLCDMICLLKSSVSKAWYCIYNSNFFFERIHVLVILSVFLCDIARSAYLKKCSNITVEKHNLRSVKGSLVLAYLLIIGIKVWV